MTALAEPQNVPAFHAGKLMLCERLSAQEIRSLADWYRQADFEAAPHDADVIPLGFVFRHFVDEYRQSSCWHFPLPRSNPERVWNEREKLNESNPVTAVIDGLATAMRRAEEPILRCRSETTQPANDNDLPRESEAA